jgi:hypothetical protein
MRVKFENFDFSRVHQTLNLKRAKPTVRPAARPFFLSCVQSQS